MGNIEELKVQKFSLVQKREAHAKHSDVLMYFLCFICRKIEIKPEALFENLNKPQNLCLALTVANELFHSSFPAMSRN